MILTNRIIINSMLTSLIVIMVSTFLYCVLALISPFSGSEGVWIGALITLLFSFVFCFISTALISILQCRNSKHTFLKWEGKMTWVPLFLSIMGVVFIVIDRVYVQGIDIFVLSAAEVRNIIAANSAVGISSLFSFFGNILQSFVIIAAMNSFMSKNGVKHILFQVLCFSVVLVSSYILGGRTPLLSYIVIMISFIVMFSAGYEIIRIFKKSFNIFFLALLFSVYIFKLRADAVGISYVEYTEIMLIHLRAENVDYVSYLNGVPSLILIVLGYLIHPFWISSEIIMGSNSGSGMITFVAPVVLLSKFIAIDLSVINNDFYQLFAPLSAGLYYDFGFVGVFFYAAIMVIIYSLSYYFLMNSNFNFPIALVMFCISTMLLSPLLHSLNFPFYILYMMTIFAYLVLIDLKKLLLEAIHK